jgi:polar amino acid transport system substrate-binding protein
MHRWRKRAWQLACAVAQGALSGLCASAHAQTLSLHYQERAPYSNTQADGSASGLTATPAAQALQQAGVPFTWTRTPGQRQLALIQEGKGLHCGLGWFRNAERAALGKFSQPLHRDRPFGALARHDSRLRSGMRGDEAMAATGETLLVKDGWSYGPQFDRLIAQRTVPPLKTSVETAQMVRMLLAGRASWMIVGADESTVLRQDVGPAAAEQRAVSFADMPRGETRHLYCNRAVPDAWLARIDQALAGPSRRDP